MTTTGDTDNSSAETKMDCKENEEKSKDELSASPVKNIIKDQTSSESKMDQNNGEKQDDETSSVTENSKPENGILSDSDKETLNYRIVRQLEFYFGDTNLCRDKFMQTHIKENDGWFTWETMFKFKRLESLSTDQEVVCAALATSTTGLIEISEDKTKVRRNKDMPVPANINDVFDAAQFRTAYAKPFPLKSELDKLQEKLEKYGVIDYIQMRRDVRKNFKGSVFIQFRNKEDCEAFVNNPDLEYENQKLIKYMKKDYMEMKDLEKKTQKEDKIQKREKDNQDRKNVVDEKLSERITKGAILQVKGLSEESKLDELKEFFNKFGECAWVDYNSGETDAKVRFKGADSGKQAIEKAKELGEGFKLGDTELEVNLLEGEEEIKQWQFIFEQNDRKNHNFKGGRGKRRSGRGGGGPPFKKRR